MNSKYIYDHPVYYDVLFGWDRSQEILFVDQLSQIYEVKGQNFLECACGTGTVSRQMAFLGWNVLGLDLSSAMVKRMNKDFSVLEKKTWAVCADMSDFRLNQKFDLIYCPLGSVGLLHDDQKVISHLNCIHEHLAPGGIYCMDVGLQKSLSEPTKVFDLNDFVWAMEVEGIYVEASDGKIKVEDEMKGETMNLLWDAVPLEYNFQHLNDLIQASKLSAQDFYPQAGVNEEGIPIFSPDEKGYREGQDRALVVLR